MKHNELSYLMNWFDLHCNRSWEHIYGIIFNTSEDFGWTIRIILEDTDLEEVNFNPIVYSNNINDWLNCSFVEKAFYISCSTNNVLKGLRIFQDWSEYLFPEITEMKQFPIVIEQMNWLLDWYELACKKGLSPKNRIELCTLDNPGWDLKVNLEGTGLDNCEYIPIEKIERTDDDWCHCFVRDNVFYAPCGNFNLGESLDMFRKFIDLQLKWL